MPKEPGPGTPKSIFPHFSYVSLSAIEFNRRDPETGLILARRAAAHKMLKKPPRPSNSGARMRGPRRRRMPSFEACATFRLRTGDVPLLIKRVTVWWTCAPFFDLLTPETRSYGPETFPPGRGGPLETNIQISARSDPFRAVSTKPLGRTHSNKWQVGFFQKLSQGPETRHGGPWGPPERATEAWGPRARHFFSRGPLALCFGAPSEGPLRCQNLKSRGPTTHRLRTGDVPLPI